MNSTLFHCPGCGYQCSPSAISCLNCGRIFRVSQVAGTPPPRTNLILWITAFLTMSVVGFLAIGLLLNTTKNTGFETEARVSDEISKQSAIDARHQFAFRLQENALANPGKYPTDFIFSTEDYLEKSDTLVVTGSSLMKKDCDVLANGEDGQTAASLGFNRVICHNRRLRSEWTLQLEKAAF